MPSSLKAILTNLKIGSYKPDIVIIQYFIITIRLVKRIAAENKRINADIILL